MLFLTGICLLLVAQALDCSFEAEYPLQYIAYKLDENERITIDGKLDEKDWEDVDFSSSFVDISTSTKPYLDTKMKMRYDDNFLYIGAVLEGWIHNLHYSLHFLYSTANFFIFIK